jgi:hypothetical protein
MEPGRRLVRRPRTLARAAAFAGVTAFVAVGCAGGPGSSADAPRLVILGIDGFDWNLVDPLVEQGRMPVMEKLLASGTRADLLTLVPLEKSPVIWTAMATGRLPADDEKGRGFLVAGGRDSTQAYHSWHRRTRAFWNILPDEGVRVSVLGWLETWPAENIDGTIVSDYVQYDVAEQGKGARFRYRTHPESLYEQVQPQVVYPHDVPEERIDSYLGRPVTEGDRSEEGIRRGLEDLHWIVAGDLTFTALARDFLEHRPEEVMAIYLRGPDAACHKFWGDREKLAQGETEARRVTLFGETVDRYFEDTDRMIGQILEKVDLDRTTVWIVSDHGFQGGRRGADGSMQLGIWMHRELGTWLAVGPEAAGRGVRVEGARVIDVLPTMLHLLDLPVADDLDGQVATWMLNDRGGASRPVDRVTTYETGEPVSVPTGLESPVDEQVAERVKSLGYVE